MRLGTGCGEAARHLQRRGDLHVADVDRDRLGEVHEPLDRLWLDRVLPRREGDCVVAAGVCQQPGDFCPAGVEGPATM